MKKIDIDKAFDYALVVGFSLLLLISLALIGQRYQKMHKQNKINEKIEKQQVELNRLNKLKIEHDKRQARIDSMRKDLIPWITED